MITARCVLALLLPGLLLAFAPEARADAVQASGEVRGDGGRLTLAWPAPVQFEARSAGSRHVLRFARPAEADFAAAIAPLQRFLGPPTIAEGGRSLSFPLQPGIVALTFADKTRVVIDLFAGFLPPATAAGEALSRASERASAPIRPPVPAPNRLGQRAGAPPDNRPGENVEDRPLASLRFDWPEPVAAAAFRRAGALWLVFDRPSVQDIARLRTAAGGTLDKLEQRPRPRATVLRIEPRPKLGAAFRRDGLAWILDLTKAAAAPATAIEPTPRQDPDGAALLLPVAEPGTPVALSDLAIGDTLVVVPVVPLGYGLARERVYPEVRLLASLQGLVVRPLVDDLAVRPGREAVELARPGGLALTPADAATRARAELRVAANAEGLLQVEPWAAQPAGVYTPARQELEAALAKAESASDRETIWLRLASLNLAHRLAAEALGALERASEARPGIAQEARFRALRGAASLLLGRLAEADADLSQPNLAEHVEAAAWRTALRVAQGLDARSGEPLAEQAAVVAGYPRVFRQALLPAFAEAAIDIRDSALAAKLEALLAAEAEGPGR